MRPYSKDTLINWIRRQLGEPVVRTSELAKVDGDVVSVQSLKDANIIGLHVKRVKVMLSGDVTRAVTLQGIGVTKGARSAIEAAGGKIEE